MPNQQQRVLIIVPAFNEEAALAGCLQDLCQAVPEASVLVVNDGSLDDTGGVARTLAQRFPQVHRVDLPVNCGIGGAVQTGLLYAHRHGFDWAVQYDGDGQHDAGCIAALLQKAADEALDLCIGSRFLQPGQEQFRSTPLRRVGIRFFSRLISALAGVRVSDPTSGFRVYGRRAIAFFSCHYPDDYPEPESLFWCVRHGLRVAEYPVRMRVRQSGASSIHTWRTVYYMVKVTLAILIDRLRRREVMKSC